MHKTAWISTRIRALLKRWPTLRSTINYCWWLNIFSHGLYQFFVWREMAYVHIKSLCIWVVVGPAVSAFIRFERRGSLLVVVRKVSAVVRASNVSLLDTRAATSLCSLYSKNTVKCWFGYIYFITVPWAIGGLIIMAMLLPSEALMCNLLSLHTLIFFLFQIWDLNFRLETVLNYCPMGLRSLIKCLSHFILMIWIFRR